MTATANPTTIAIPAEPVGRITGAARGFQEFDNTDDNLTARPLDPWTTDTLTEYAKTRLATLIKVHNRHAKWFAAVQVWSAEVKATGIYDEPFDAERHSAVLASIRPPKGRAPGKNAKWSMYEDAAAVRRALADLGFVNIPGRPHSMEGLDNVIAFACQLLGVTRKPAR